MSKNGYYSEEIEYRILIFYLTGHLQVIFYIIVKEDLTYIAELFMIRQQKDGSWGYYFIGAEYPLAGGKAAGMT